MLKRWISGVVAWLFCMVVGSIPAGAHDLPLDRMMNGLVKIESRQADFVVRVPLDLLLGVPFPLAGTTTTFQRPGPPSKPLSKLWRALSSCGRAMFVSCLRAPPASWLRSRIARSKTMIKRLRRWPSQWRRTPSSLFSRAI